MRTVSRELALPEGGDRAPDEMACSILLPSRTTRVLYSLLAVILGVAAGLLYSRYFLREPGVLWTVAIAALGAFLGVLVVLMPAAIVRGLRRVMTRLSLALRSRRLRGELARAERELRSRLEDDRDDAETWNALGVVTLLRGRTREAAEALERACQLDGARFRVNLAAALAEERNLEAAAEELAEAAGDESTVEAARHNTGVLLARRPPPEVVERLVNEPEQLTSPIVLNNLGAYELAAGRLDAAERYFSRAASSDPAAVGPRANLALIAYRRGRIKKAIAQLDAASVLDPLDPGLASNLGAMLCAGGRPMLAARQLSRAAFLAPGSPAVDLNRAAVRLALGRYEDALASFNEGPVRAAYPREAAHDEVLALVGLKHYQTALERAEAALEEGPDDAGLRNNLACVAWALGDDSRMTQELGRITTDAEDAAVILNLAIARISSGDPGGARSLLSALEERRGPEPAIEFTRGLGLLVDALSLYRHEMTREQRNEFFRALHRCVRPLTVISDKETGASMEARLNLALYHYLRSEYEAAAQRYEEAARTLTHDGFWYYCAGTVLLEWAVSVQQAHEAEGEELVARARTLMRRARSHLETAVAHDEQTADAFCNLGVCAYGLGDMEAAKSAFRRMVQLEETAEAMNRLAIVHARETERLQRAARAAGLASRLRERELLQDAQTQISTALHYFLEALEQARDDPVLHGNIGLAFMLRNRETDVEAALRHWQRMLALGGAAQRQRYEELTAVAHTEGVERATFDETIMELRPLDPLDCIVAPPPGLAGPRYALQTVAEEPEWHLVTDDPRVQRVLRSRDRVSGLSQRMARLSM
ncbi:MAG: tetratricopeptide repeat protein [Armatimonadota bacterium]|nr:tetratricopeptide repeat protein [Armatimonadota bacterium]